MDKQQQSNSRTADDGLPSTVTKDIDLAFEEEHAILYAEHEALKKKHADFITRFERLQQNHDELLDHSNETDRQLQSLQSSNDGDQADYVKSLKSQLQEANELIANQEQQAETDRMTKEKQQKELSSLRQSAQRVIDLEDQVKELKTENQTLSRKANTVDHFQRKLELQSGVEKENASLRQRIDKMEETQKDLDAVYDENTKIKTTIEEYQKRFNSYELQVVELSNQKKVLEEDLRHQNAQVDALRASKQHDEKYIEDLQEQVRTVATAPLPPNSPTGKSRGLTLEEELEESDESTPNYALEISRLKAENQLLRSNTAGTTNVTLRIDLEEAERIRKRLEENLRDLTEKYTIGQEQLQAIISTSSGEKLVKIVDCLIGIGPLQILTEDFYRNEAVVNTRRLYLEANQELSSTKTKVAELEAELSSRDRELLGARADRTSQQFPHILRMKANITIVSAIDREEIDALEDLKATNEIITSSITNDLLLAQSKLKNLTTDHEQQKSHLVEALLAKDKLRQELASAREGKSAVVAPEATTEATTEAQAKEEKARTALDALKEVSCEIDTSKMPKSSKKARKFWRHFPHLPFRPYTTKPEPPQNTIKPDDFSLHEAELALERAAIGALPPVKRPLISPRTIPLPMSPLPVRVGPRAVFRTRV
jgi:protein HOOK3